MTDKDTQNSSEMSENVSGPNRKNVRSKIMTKALEALPELLNAGLVDGPGLYKIRIPQDIYKVADQGPEIVEPQKTYLVGNVLRKSAGDEERYTFGVVYKASHPDQENFQLDAHSEFIGATELQKSLWKYVQKGNRDIYVQHGMNKADGMKKAGEWVEITTWPQEYKMPLVQKDGATKEITIPPGSAYMGVLWEPWAWERVKLSDDDPMKIRGYSLGGRARREVLGDVE